MSKPLFKEPTSISVGDFGEDHLHVIIFCLKIHRFIQTLFKQNHQNYLIRWWNPAEVGIPVVIFPPHTNKKWLMSVSGIQKEIHFSTETPSIPEASSCGANQTQKGWWIDTILRKPSQSHPKWKVQVQSTLLEQNPDVGQRSQDRRTKVKFRQLVVTEGRINTNSAKTNTMKKPCVHSARWIMVQMIFLGP